MRRLGLLCRAAGIDPGEDAEPLNLTALLSELIELKHREVEAASP